VPPRKQRPPTMTSSSQSVPSPPPSSLSLPPLEPSPCLWTDLSAYKPLKIDPWSDEKLSATQLSDLKVATCIYEQLSVESWDSMLEGDP